MRSVLVAILIGFSISLSASAFEVQGYERKKECLFGLIKENLQKTAYKDVQVLDVSMPWMGNEYSFKGIDSNGQRYHGKIRATINMHETFRHVGIDFFLIPGDRTSCKNLRDTNSSIGCSANGCPEPSFKLNLDLPLVVEY